MYSKKYNPMLYIEKQDSLEAEICVPKFQKSAKGILYTVTTQLVNFEKNIYI